MYNLYIFITTINHKRQYLCLKLFWACKWKSLLPKLAIQGSPLITPLQHQHSHSTHTNCLNSPFSANLQSYGRKDCDFVLFTVSTRQCGKILKECLLKK